MTRHYYQFFYYGNKKMDLGITSNVLPPEIVNKIIYYYGGLRTPTARIIRDRLDEYENHKKDTLDNTHIELDLVFIYSWSYFAMNYSKNKYNYLSLI